MPLNILILEDDINQFNSYIDARDDNDIFECYNLLHATNVACAKEIISKNMIHAAILDLSIPKSSGEQDSKDNGVIYLKDLLAEKQFPIVVVSANITFLPDHDPDYPKHMKKMLKTPLVYSKVFEHFNDLNDLLKITPTIFITIKEIQDEFKNAFWDLWGNWEEFNARFSHTDPDLTKVFFKRYVCSYLFEKWMVDDLFNKMHHSEFYAQNSFKERIHTGDILKLECDTLNKKNETNEGKNNTNKSESGIINKKYENWIVMTAPCNLSNKNYPKNLTLLKCEYIDLKTYSKVLNPPWEEVDDKQKSIKKNTINEYFTNPPLYSHYLPPWNKNERPVNVLFKEIKTVPFEKNDRDALKLKRVATLSYHFLPYLLQRYGSYVSRIGQSEIYIEDYIQYLSLLAPDSTNN